VTSSGTGHPGLPAGGIQDWQAEAWYFLDSTGELAFAASWFANAMSRVRLYIERSTADGGEEEVVAGPAVDALNSLAGGPAGQSQMLAAAGLHLFVPGEFYLVGEADEAGNDTWTLYSNAEVKPQGTGGRYQVDRGDGEKRLIDTDPEAAEPAVVIRIWRSHPRLWVEATSPCRAVLPILRELEGLTKSIGASIDSRLAGAGILMLPSEMTFTAPPAPPSPAGTPAEGPPPASDASTDQFVADLAEAMLTPIKDRGNASAVVPIVVRAPGALIGNAKHITFATPLDDKSIDLRSEAIRRLALGLDMPPEVLLGTGDVNHWGAWQIEEAALKTHIEPACELVCAALTERWLYPHLEAQGQATEFLVIAADTSDLRLRPDHTAEAFQLYDRLEINGIALRRETGFDEGDAPDPPELEAMLLQRAATGALTPELVAAALDALGVDLYPEPANMEEAAGGPAPTPPTTGEQEPPAVPETAIENRRDIPDQAAATLLAGAWPLAHRAVERARNKHSARSKTIRPVPPDRLEACMTGAIDRRLTGQVAQLVGCDPTAFDAAIEGYARDRLLAGADHDPRLLVRRLRAARARTALAAPEARRA